MKTNRQQNKNNSKTKKESKPVNRTVPHINADSEHFFEQVKKELDAEEEQSLNTNNRKTKFGSNDKKEDMRRAQSKKTYKNSEKKYSDIANKKSFNSKKRENHFDKFDKKTKNDNTSRYSDDYDNKTENRDKTYKKTSEYPKKYPNKTDKNTKFNKKTYTHTNNENKFDNNSKNKKNYGQTIKKTDLFEDSYIENKNREIRLNSYISNAGICSRRKADQLIKSGEITVNGKVENQLGTKVKLSDKVGYNGKTLDPQKKVYILLNKTKNTLSTLTDPQGRRTVIDLIKGATRERVYPVGRLDRNTTGLLLLTNDGEITTGLAHPSSNVPKLYHVVVNKDMAAKDIEKLQMGIELEDGLTAVDYVSYANDKKNEIGVEIHSGKNRIVRRMIEHLGYEVIKLDRVIYAGLTKKMLPRGKWRFLTPIEVSNLYVIVNKSNKTDKKQVRAGFADYGAKSADNRPKNQNVKK